MIKKRRIIKYSLLSLIVLLSLAVIVSGYLFLGKANKPDSIRWGITFSNAQAEYVGVEWRDAYTALLDDLGVRHVRIPIYWNQLEREKGEYNFEKWDWQLDQLEKRGGKAILVIGRKLPRWPECHIPEWAENLSREEQDKALLNAIEATVKHYRDREVVERWQVENELFVPFGECPEPNKEVFDKEISLVRELDDRPVVITDAGQGSFWLVSAKRADIVGASVYRFIREPTFGLIRYPFPPVMYDRKKKFAQLFYPDTKFISAEFQAEPWPITGSVEGDYETMDPERFKDHIEYAKNTGFDEIYLWGAEWWYWLKQEGDPEIWEYAKTLF